MGSKNLVKHMKYEYKCTYDHGGYFESLNTYQIKAMENEIRNLWFDTANDYLKTYRLSISNAGDVVGTSDINFNEEEVTNLLNGITIDDREIFDKWNYINTVKKYSKR